MYKCPHTRKFRRCEQLSNCFSTICQLVSRFDYVNIDSETFDDMNSEKIIFSTVRFDYIIDHETIYLCYQQPFVPDSYLLIRVVIDKFISSKRVIPDVTYLG